MHPSSDTSAVDATADGVHGNVHPSGDGPSAGVAGAGSSSAGDGPSVGVAGAGTEAAEGAPRYRRAYADAGTGQTRLPDWTRFNVQVSLKNLRSWNPSVIQKELRKLHLRWWHAKEPKMRAILHAAGLDNARLDMIKPVCDTCRECRAWDPPGHKTMPSISLPTKFNTEGECDLMFYKRKIAFHIIDRTIRLSDGCEIQDRHKDTLLDAYATSWVQRHGPLQSL